MCIFLSVVSFFYFLIGSESTQANATLLLETQEVKQGLNQLNQKVIQNQLT